ncbi:ABC transporter ATP-binding protein [Acuticoccus kandeliae]|uniref:ABC transporter ATP-binding protein n=1 Tax=Acuticoccus kandeliae TaxID=2073160 RepID=UPI000D3ECC40|nr:ABC transporter ATP-binding protein [Acuticoccus kandeliae]
MASLEIENLRVSYGANTILPDLSLKVGEGECVALLGPSGCGKTTTLRSIAGFVRPDRGQIRIGGTNVLGRPAHKRNVGLVFQDYALFPHMNVAENVAYGLIRRRVPKAEIATRVDDALRLVRLDTFGERYPAQMSGGQRQRVALARAIVVKPDILLLDEPLGALDRKLRDEMQFELKTLQNRLGLTSIIVTHDQEEALSLAQRVALMFDGDIAEIGPPAELYHRPKSARAMDFLGASSIFEGEVAAVSGGEARLVTTGGAELVGTGAGLAEGAKVHIGVRPERITLTTAPREGDNVLKGTVVQSVFKGGAAELYVKHAGEAFRVAMPTDAFGGGGIEAGAEVWAEFAKTDVLVFPHAR